MAEGAHAQSVCAVALVAVQRQLDCEFWAPVARPARRHGGIVFNRQNADGGLWAPGSEDQTQKLAKVLQ